MSRWIEAWFAGGRLSAGEARALETEARADDLRAHVQLLGYYFSQRGIDHTGHDAHALWLVARHPELDLDGLNAIDPDLSPEAFAESVRLWCAAVAAHPASTTVLGNAAACLQHGEPALAAEFLRRGASQEPDVAHWYADLARLCPEGDPESVRLLEQALALEPTGGSARGVAIELARASFAASDHTRAASYASRLLACTDDGEAIHVGHIVLGRLALSGGDVRAATAHLAAAGASPCAAGFMPDQVLAVELLDHGMREAVVAYADACKRFYRGGLGLLGAAFRGAGPLELVKR